MSSTVSSSVDASELRIRAIDALVNLLHSLDTLDSVEEVARRALLIVSGQLLVRRAAVYVLNEDDRLRLESVIGMGRGQLELDDWVLTSDCHNQLRAGGVMKIECDGSTPDIISESFDQVAHLVNGEVTIGVLLIGGSLGSHTLDDQDMRLIETMGAVIGTLLYRVQVQQQLIEARLRKEEAEAIRRSVMDHVSHEFNTPLMVVKSTGDMLRVAVDPERDELLDMHEEAVGRLEQLVKSILRVANEFIGDVTPDPLPVTILRDSILRPWVDRETDDSCVFLVENIDTEVFVAVDPMRMELVLKELYANAREAQRDAKLWVIVHLYCAPPGWWTSQNHTHRFQRYRDALEAGLPMNSILWDQDPPSEAKSGEPTEVVLEMIDLGIGIPAGECELVFEAFSQARNSPTRGIRGAGLGLPTCLRLVQELRGTMSAQSAEGKGSAFAVLLPGVRR